MIVKTRVYRLKPDEAMKQILDDWCNYRRYCWNQDLALWQDLYMARTIFDKVVATTFIPKQNKKTKKWRMTHQDYHLNPSPNWRLVRDLMIEQKEDWQYAYSARTLQLAVQDLGKAWQNFFNKAQPDWGKPKFRSKKNPRQGFKTDRAKIEDGLLWLEMPRDTPYKDRWAGIELSNKPLSGKIGVVSIFKVNHKYYASIPYKLEKPLPKAKTGKGTGVDINVGHFNYQDGQCLVLPKSLKRLYAKIKFYQKRLAKKRTVNGRIKGTQSNKYLKTKTKLQSCYERVSNIQHDLMHKFTTKLVNDYDQIVIENLDVKGMLMSHVASKGMHRSMFGLFRQLLAYKCDWYDKELILANKLYPSTQRCAVCGMVKKGDEKVTLKGNQKHGTKHNEYICYNPDCPNYGKVVDRDENAMKNLTLLISNPELNKAI